MAVNEINAAGNMDGREGDSVEDAGTLDAIPMKGSVISCGKQKLL